MRTLSFTEISTALQCEAKHDFSYGDRLAGSALKSKTVLPVLSGGRAWGAMVAAWHASDDPDLAHVAMCDSLDGDAERQREFGVHDREQHTELRERLERIFAHYVTIGERLPLRWLEGGVLVALPALNGSPRPSSKYRFLAYFDGIHEDAEGRVWLVEFKLRARLSALDLVANSRQLRWYAWAYQRKLGKPVAGVITDERWNEFPKEPRLVKSRRRDTDLTPSHATDQLTTPGLYLAVCREHGVEPLEHVVQSLAARRWQARHPIAFTPSELEQAGQELVSAAALIHDLDVGRRYPLRNVRPATCGGCIFRQICSAPDPGLVDALFERKSPKRDRPAEGGKPDGT